MKRNHEVRIKLSRDEKEKLTKKAMALGMPLSSFLRYLALSSKIDTYNE